MRAEHWWYTLPLRIRSIFRRDALDRELDEEMRFHLDQLIEEGIARGLSPAEARNSALRAMGGLEQRKEEARDMRHVRWFTDSVDDVRYAWRSLRRAPGLSLFVVVTLALGIGMTSGPLSMVDALVFRPYPIPHPGQLVSLTGTTPRSGFELFSYREYLDIRDHTHSYDGVIATGDYVPFGYSVKPSETARVRGGMLVSGNFFSVLGVRPELGRAFHPDEDQVPGRDPVVVLGSDFWTQELARDSSIVGRTIRLNGTDFTVIGVAPESFPGLQVFVRPDFYVPFAMARRFSAGPGKDLLEDRDDRQLTVRGRLKHGTSLEQAREELALLARDLEREHPQLNRNRGAMVRTQFQMRTRADAGEWKFGVIFVILSLAVLFTACTNAAGLLLSRASTRTREIAVRLALGATRSRLIRMLLTESLLLAGLGGAAGVGVGFATISFLQRFSIPATLPVHVPFRMDARLLLASTVISLVSAIAFGLAPALQGTRSDLVSGLKAAEVEASGRKRLWGRNLLVVAQVSASLMLLAASFLMQRGFQRSFVEGFEFATTAKDHVLMASFDPRLLQYDDARTQRFYTLLTQRARQTSGVRSAGLTQTPPLGIEDFESVSFVPEGVQMPANREAFNSTMDIVDEGFFDAMDVPIVRGRGFEPGDDTTSRRVAIVNEHFADHYWPGVDAVGKRIRLGASNGMPVEIVGIAKTIRYRHTTEKPIDFIYLPLAQRPSSRMTLLLRASAGPLTVLEPLKDIVRSLDRNLPIVSTRTYMTLYRYSTVQGPGVAIEMVATMGGMALLLAIAGLYGLVAYNVTRRTKEIGIRMALGATRGDVLRLVLGKGMRLVATGTVIGLVLGFALEQLMNSVLFNLHGVDVVVYLVAVPGMFLAAMLAAYIPALRACRIEPTRALRYE